MNENIIQVLTASLGAAGFGMLFNVHGKKLLWIAAGGGLGWLVYLLTEIRGGCTGAFSSPPSPSSPSARSSPACSNRRSSFSSFPCSFRWSPAAAFII